RAGETAPPPPWSGSEARCGPVGTLQISKAQMQKSVKSRRDDWFHSKPHGRGRRFGTARIARIGADGHVTSMPRTDGLRLGIGLAPVRSTTNRTPTRRWNKASYAIES